MDLNIMSQAGEFAGHVASPLLNNVDISQSQVMGRLQSILQLHLFKSFSSGNFFIDTLAQLFMMTLVTYMLSQVKSILDSFCNYIKYICKKLYNGIINLYYRIVGKTVKFTKYVEIPYISDNRQINELYRAVSWYLSTNTEIDYAKESDLQYVYDRKIIPENFYKIKSDLAIAKILNQNKTKVIKFKNYSISYELNTDIITVYTDKEKKRENYKIKLWLTIDNFVKNDIIEEFCQQCITKYMESLTVNSWKQMIYVNKEDGKWQYEESKNTRKLETIILQNALKEEIKNDFQRFIDSEDWYNSLDIPYSRGYLFFGKPGTGKTSLIRGLSLNFKRHIHFLMLQNIKSDIELLDLLKNINYKETILVIEDIDAMVASVKSRDAKIHELNSDSDSETDSDNETNKKRRRKRNKKRDNEEVTDYNTPSYKKREVGFDKNNKKNNKGITLSGLLNALDGIVSTPGRILIMTTNHPEILDDALIRPGRCDAKFQFNFCDRKQIREIYQLFFNKPIIEKQLESVKAYEYSPAHITAVFLRYRNEPEEAIKHLDDIEQKVVIKPMIEMTNYQSEITLDTSK